ncbi:MAG: hypothetical protein HC936_08020 [Leptolyngbyaceae cyanobacterium SU_3_3]|nr:hypothetical protein [Leptolyngbyaceae cyanobacterium SU_3_3]NJR52629.1 hypothetical protein [Leptolyngbyaceae cyanobacterium CSU_1_3]
MADTLGTTRVTVTRLLKVT